MSGEVTIVDEALMAGLTKATIKWWLDRVRNSANFPNRGANADLRTEIDNAVYLLEEVLDGKFAGYGVPPLGEA